MARRRRTSSTRQSSRVEQDASDRWPNLQELIESDGTLNIGQVEPLPSCTAIAAQGRQVYAMLAVEDDETLTDILNRLDAAIEKALDDGTITDEINR